MRLHILLKYIWTWVSAGYLKQSHNWAGVWFLLLGLSGVLWVVLNFSAVDCKMECRVWYFVLCYYFYGYGMGPRRRRCPIM